MKKHIQPTHTQNSEKWIKINSNLINWWLIIKIINETTEKYMARMVVSIFADCKRIFRYNEIYMYNIKYNM